MLNVLEGIFNMIKPIKTRKSYEAVIEQIIDFIRHKKLLPGDKLDSIDILANRFGVSRSVVREALTSLRAMGLIHIVQGEGTFIKDFDAASISIPVTSGLLMKKENVKELFEVRKILEVGAVELAAITRTANDVEKMKLALDAMKENTNSLNEKTDYHFHYEIVKATKNDMLLHLLRSISEIMMETMQDAHMVIFQEEENGNRLIREHELIFESIKKQDPELAKKTMLEHLDGVLALYFPMQ